MPENDADPKSTNEEELKRVLEIWKISIDVQKHFNDLELRIRNFAITLVVAMLSVAAFALKENVSITLASRELPLAAAILLFSGLGWIGFYLMDRFWYHRLLYGAVNHAMAIENEYGSRIPHLNLTTMIGRESAMTVPYFGWKLRTPRKMDIFYGFGLVFLWGSALFVACSHQ